MADHKDLHLKTQGPTSQFLNNYTCVSTTGKKMMNNWTFWHIDHIEHCIAMGLAPAKPMTFWSSSSFARSWGVVPRNTTQLRKPNLRNSGCAIPAICSGPWKVRPWNRESKTTIDCLFCFQEICVFKRKPTPPILRPLLRQSVDPNEPTGTADTSELQQTNQDILRILKVWKVKTSWHLKVWKFWIVSVSVDNQDHTFQPKILRHSSSGNSPCHQPSASPWPAWLTSSSGSWRAENKN